MFAHDRDLLVLEPMLLGSALFAAHTLVRGAATVEESQARFDGANLIAAGVQPGMLATVGGVPMEIASVVSEERAEVSLVRLRGTDPVRPVPNVPSASGAIVTYEPQIALVHAQLLTMLGLSAGVTADGGELAEDRITNPGELTLLEALGALHMIFAAASTLTGPESPAGQRAEHYRERYARQRWIAQARIDTDGDGVADATRRLNVGRLVRG